MSQLLESRIVQVLTTHPIVGFACLWSNISDSAPVHLRVGHTDAYILGYRDTYDLTFELQPKRGATGLQKKVSSNVCAAILRQGLQVLDDTVVNAHVELMQKGMYLASLWNVRPYLVTRGTYDDYFTDDQSLAGRGSRDPGTPYYRTEGTGPLRRARADYKLDTRSIGHVDEARSDRPCVELILPLEPIELLQQHVFDEYQEVLESGGTPTAVAISMLEYDSYDRTAERWCLTHCLLDGHHKMYVAARLRRPLTLLSFLALGHSRMAPDLTFL